MPARTAISFLDNKRTKTMPHPRRTQRDAAA
jgi:hypothetical protein